MSTSKHSVIDKTIVNDNETAARSAYQRGDYVSCFLLVHSLIEALLRAFLTKTKKERFSDLITAYATYLQQEGQARSTFVDELTGLNRRRNRIVHELWRNGYTATNKTLEPICRAAFIVYGLFIEWLETFQPEITDFGFEYETPAKNRMNKKENH